MNFDEIEEDTTEAHERGIVRCRSCRARIIWLVTVEGKKIPVDADTVKPDQSVFVWGEHITHFQSCPDAGAWRNRKRIERP